MKKVKIQKVVGDNLLYLSNDPAHLACAERFIELIREDFHADFTVEKNMIAVTISLYIEKFEGKQLRQLIIGEAYKKVKEAETIIENEYYNN